MKCLSTFGWFNPSEPRRIMDRGNFTDYAEGQVAGGKWQVASGKWQVASDALARWPILAGFEAIGRWLRCASDITPGPLATIRR
jgi:hypothetical protein